MVELGWVDPPRGGRSQGHTHLQQELGWVDPPRGRKVQALKVAQHLRRGGGGEAAAIERDEEGVRETEQVGESLQITWGSSARATSRQ